MMTTWQRWMTAVALSAVVGGVAPAVSAKEAAAPTLAEEHAGRHDEASPAGRQHRQRRRGPRQRQGPPETPPGWSKGRKEGWHGGSVPPGRR